MKSCNPVSVLTRVLISGVRSRGMTPEVTQETGRRRTTSEGQYQSSHENTPMVDSPDFAHNLALNPGGRPREVCRVIRPAAMHNIITQCEVFICVYTCPLLIFSRVPCTATGRRLRTVRQRD